MDQDPFGPNPPQPQPEPRMPPPPPRPAAPPPAAEYAPYRLPPHPPRRGSSVWRILGNLLGLCLLIFIVLLVAGLAFSIWGGGSMTNLTSDHIGLLRMEGEISQGETLEFWLKTLRDFAATDRVKGVLVRIDSPGGTVGASQELNQAIRKIRSEHHKPVYISMGDVAASGGYYTAAAADRIFAMRGTLTGSIGVILSRPDVTSLTQKLGYHSETIKSGKLKDAGDMFRAMTEEERKFFNVLIMDTYNQFIGDVLDCRREPLAKAAKAFKKWDALMLAPPADDTPEAFLRQVADGRVYTGDQALLLGLIDEIGSLEDTKAALGKRLGLGARPAVHEVIRRRGISDLLGARVSDWIPGSRFQIKYLMPW